MRPQDVITHGGTALEDRTALDKTIRWYRNGTRGHLHPDRYCYKLDTHKQPQSVELSITEAGKKQLCTSCFHQVVDYRTWTAMAAYSNAATRLKTLQTQLGETRSKPAELGNLLRSESTWSEMWLQVDTSLIWNAKRNIDARAEELFTAARERVDGALELTGTQIALYVIRRESAPPSNVRQRFCIQAVPGATLAEYETFGRPTSQAGENKNDRAEWYLEYVFRRWLSLRAGDTLGIIAASEARAVAGEAQLVLASQLDHVASAATAAGRSMRETAEVAWRDQINSIVDQLIKSWEDLYQELLNLKSEQTVTAARIKPGYSLSETELGLLHTLLAAGDGRRHGAHVMLRSNKLFDRFIASVGILDSTADGPLDEAIYDTAAGIWDPDNLTGEYCKFTAAYAAAAALNA